MKRQDDFVSARNNHDLLIDRVAEVSHAYHRLVLVVGVPRSGKTGVLAATVAVTAWPQVNVNLALSERLLDLTVKQRSVRVPALVDEIVRLTTAHADIVILDNIEILFATELALDPLRLLLNLSRHRTVIAAWPGTWGSGVLTYAEPGHPEYRKYSKQQFVVVGTSAANDSPEQQEGAQ